MMLWIPALVLPVLFWQQGVETAPELRKAGITHIAVPAADVARWKTIAGMVADPVDLAATIKLPPPGVALRIDEASASHVPWVSSNGWRFMRQADARFYYDIPANTTTLAAAEAFTFGGQALISTGVNGIEPFAKMSQFLRTINSDQAKPLADIGFIDDNSALSAEVMNLMIRDNLLFKIIPSLSEKCKLTVQLGSKDYEAGSVNDADPIVHKIRANLTDARRSVRIFGTSVVIAHVTGEADKPRVHLLNYGAPAHIRVGAFRVRVLGRYSKFQIHCFDSPDVQLMDVEVQSDATEFTLPDLKTYAVVELAR